MVFDVTERDFEAQVLERSRTMPVVVDFWAEWCGPCRQLTPVLEQAVAAREGKVALAKLDTDRNPTISRAFGIQGIPAVKAFKDGRIAAEFTGAQPRAHVERFLDALIPSEADALVASGDEASLRAALEREPNRATRMRSRCSTAPPATSAAPASPPASGSGRPARPTSATRSRRSTPERTSARSTC
jgi:putative thioredoxin